MGDLTVATVKPKEGGGPSAISCPMLTSTNYTVWSIRMKIMLQLNKVWEIIETDDDDKEKNILAMALLFQSIPETLILQVGQLKTAKKVCEAIRMRHVGADRVKEARLQTLSSEFDHLTVKDTETINSFVGKLSAISSKATALGAVIEEPKLVKKLLKSLPRKKYIHMVASLEQMLDLSTTRFEDIVGRLKAYEERIFDEEEAQENESKLMYTNYDAQSGRNSNESYIGRGREGRFFTRERGRDRNGGRDVKDYMFSV